MLHELNDSNFDSETAKGICVVDFWAQWCGPCKMIEPVLKQLSEDIDNVKFTKLNVEENPQTVAKLSVINLPTLLFLKDGKIMNQLVGTVSEDKIRQAISSL